jgi:DNA-binding LacI/PurR family transcriptional regulator
MIPDLRNPFFGDVVSGIQARAGELGFRVLFNTGLRQPDLEEDAIEGMLELRTDGLILAAPRVDDAVIIHAGHWVPVVVINRSPPDDSCDAVSNDNIAGAALAVEHLADLGHRHIALIEGGAGIAARTRYEGYLRAMHRLGLDEFVLTAKGAHSEEGGRRGAHDLLQAEPFPTAIFASNDLCAIGALDALEEAGLTIPDDVSLIGFDNTTLAALRHISLTSINQPGSDMGMSAVERLRERIEGERTSPRRDIVAPSLVIRSTTGPPRDDRAGELASIKPIEDSHHLSDDD